MTGVRFLTDRGIYPLTTTPRMAVKHKPTAYRMGFRGQSFRTANPTIQLHPAVKSMKKTAQTIATKWTQSPLFRLTLIYCTEHGHTATRQKRRPVSHRMTQTSCFQASVISELPLAFKLQESQFPYGCVLISNLNDG